MSLNKDVVTGTIVAGTMVGLFFLIKKLHKVQLDLVAIPTAILHKINLSGVTIRVDVLLKNPTSASFSVKWPFVKLFYKGTMIGSSEVMNKDIEIPAHGQVKIEKIMVDIPLESAFSVITTLIKSIQDKQSVVLTANISSNVFVGLMNLPFNQDYKITI